MATLNTRDPVQGLIDYVQDVKPYHTKILEVWVEYIYGDAVNGTVNDKMKMEIDIAFDRMRKYCDYGWDMQVWGKMLADLNIDDIVPGTITYNTGSTVKKSVAYQTYFDYLCDVWRANNGFGDAPIISAAPSSKYYILNFSSVLDAAKAYFASINQNFQYWYEPSSRKLYKKVGIEWHEQSAYVSVLEPVDAVDMDVWVNTTNMTLFVYMSGTWQENTNFYVAYNAPQAPPRYPAEWNSAWDRPTCTPPYGETWVYAFVTDELTFDHGSELFLNESIRTMVFDPSGAEGNTGPGASRVEYPIKYKTTVTQDSSGRYNITRQEVSIVTDPTNSEIINNPYPITLDGYEFEGFGIDRNRKGVRFSEFLVWKYNTTTNNMQMVADTVLNRETFGFKVVDGALVAQTVTSTGRTDIDCPFNDGQIVYFTSSDDLPTYTLLTQDYRRPVALMRYQPYKIKKITSRSFSLVLVKAAAQFNAITGNRIAPAYTTYEEDTIAMGSSPYLTFATSGYGDLYFGLGHPIAFIETRAAYKEATMVGRFKDGISSTSEAFPGFRYSQISDVLVGFDDHGTTRNAFVVEGDQTKLEQGEIIQILGSSGSKNDGDWVVAKTTLWTNVVLDSSGIPTRDSTGRMTQISAPAWWNDLIMGPWPTANLLGTEYYKVSTISVAGTAPSTQFPYGNIASRYYNFTEPTADTNIAKTQVNEQLLFGSYLLTKMSDGTWQMVPEIGAPGMSMIFKDAVNVSIQEQFAPNGYGIPTIGSFDVHYYDVASYDNFASESADSTTTPVQTFDVTVNGDQVVSDGNDVVVTKPISS